MYQRGHHTGQSNSRFLSHIEHEFLYDYFKGIAVQNLDDFPQMWDRIKKFDHHYSNRLSLIPFLIARGMPNHNAGSAAQRNAIKHMKDNFSIWEQRAMAAMHKFDGRAISTSMWSLAVLGIKPSDMFMRRWFSQTKKCIHSNDLDMKFEAKNYSLTVLGLGMLQSQNPDMDFKTYYEEIRSHIDDSTLFSLENIKQVHDADLFFTGASTLNNPDREETISNDEKRLADIFRAAGYKVYKSETCPIPHLHQAIDFTVEDKKGDKVHIECDGPTHFHNPDAKDIRNLKYDLSTRFRSALMTLLAPDARIVRIDFRMLETLIKTKPQTQKKYCTSVFNTALNRGAGCYHASMTKELLTDMVKKPNEERDSIPAPSSAATSPRPAGVNDNGELLDPQTHPRSQLRESHFAPAYAAK